jgi:hypothetical protein
MTGYEDYGVRLQSYIESANQCTIPFEIIVVEDINQKNSVLLKTLFSAEYFKEKHVRHIQYQAKYPNPHNYNMIEAFSKNIGIYAAKYDFICVTNCDITFNDAFFPFLKTIQPQVFYRFLQYEKDNVNETCINSDLKDKSKWTLNAIAKKSGDIMLMDKTSWYKIKGYPENTVWVHSDLIVCKVVNNNKIPVVVPPQVKIYTLPQIRKYSEQPYEIEKTLEYFNVCN